VINNILITEDDKEIVEILSMHIADENKNIFVAHDGRIALDIFNKHSINLMLIDIMIPEINGLNLIKIIRQKSNVPIIVISARSTDEDKILGLNLGADDYIQKPFKVLEVAARVNAQLRRFNKLGANNITQNNSLMNFGELTLDTSKIKLIKKGVEIEITTAEYKILKLLMESPSRVFTKTQIYNDAFGDFLESDESTVMVHISNLRSKIEDDSKNPKYIKTVRGLGYKFEQ